jgi:hypothetical protein
MATSSAKPGNLLQYRDGGLAQVEAWTPEVTTLGTDLDALRSALAAADLPAECDVSVLFYDTWFDTLTQNQRHLDEWVGDLANAFIEAAGLDPATFDRMADTVLSADNASILVGYADRARSEAQAEEDAAALQAILTEAGLVHPYDIGNNPEKLEELVAQYPALRDILARSERLHHDENYAVALVNGLGPQDVRTMIDLTNTFGYAQDRGQLDGDAWAGYVVPFATILGNADRSGRMDPSVRSAIFDMDATDEPPIAGLNVDSIQENQLLDMRYRTLALLSSAGTFSPQTSAEMADAILNDGPVAPDFQDLSGFTNAEFLGQHRELASNQWAAYAALERDPEAANVFYSMDDDGDGRFDNLYQMQENGGGADVAAWRLGISADELNDEIQQTVANGVRGGILDYPLAAGTTYDHATTNLVTQAIEAGGWEHIQLSDPVRQALAQVTTPYTIDIAVGAEGGGADLPTSRLSGLDQDEIDRFMQEVSESEGARVVLSQNAAALVRDQIGAAAPDIAADDSTAFGTGGRLTEAYYRELGEAWDEVQVGWQEQREALIKGWRTVTDPVVNIVSGKIVEHVPVVGDLPGVSAVTKKISDGINTAVYDLAIPEPELEAMTEWRDAIGPEVYDSVAAGIYDDPDTRARFLREAGLDPSDPITIEEFRALPDVQDAVNTYGDGILDGLQAEMAFDKVFDTD